MEKTKKTVPTADTPSTPEKPSSEAVIFMDDDTWVWELSKCALDNSQIPFTKLPSNMTLRQSWNRFSKAPHVILHWETTHRLGGALLEEIIGIAPSFDVANRVIVITTNPVHEDVVHFAELGVRRIVRPRQRDADMAQAIVETQDHVRSIMDPKVRPDTEQLWSKIFDAIGNLPSEPNEIILAKIETSLERLNPNGSPRTARYLEALGALRARTGKLSDAESLLQEAIEINPNYFRAWNRLIDIKRKQGSHQEAYQLLQKMQMHNRGSIRRLVALGEELIAMGGTGKAELYFQGALDKDGYCAGALNGLAEIKFWRDELDEARRLLSKSDIASKVAARLNASGIEMVRAGRFEQALHHYSKAQYVLPHREKGPLLLYNIALCYAKWEKNPMAEAFLKLALIKEPNYKKAARLLEQIQSQPEAAAYAEPDAGSSL